MALRSFLLVLAAVGAASGLGLVALGARTPTSISEPALAAAATSAVPTGSVTLDDAGVAVPAFEVDALEVSVGEYARCVRAGDCTLYATTSDPRAGRKDFAERHYSSALCRGGRADRANEPMNCVDWPSAGAYCKWAGKRLPTREEWWRAIGSRHPADAESLHRATKEHSWFAGEWTASPGGGKKRGPWPELRWVGMWRLDRQERAQQFAPFEDWLPTSTRLSTVGFRCAK